MSQHSYAKRAVWLIAGTLLFRLVHAWLLPTNLAGDEAYYWDWGRRLDWGYYSKPPFIAWFYALVDWIGGGSLFGVRAASALLGAAGQVVLYRLATLLFDKETAWTTLLLSLAAPATSALSFFLTIDAPLVLFWLLALWFFWRWVSDIRPGLSLLLLVPVLGLGHLTKQMMLVFPVLAVIFLALEPDTRQRLRRPSFWLAILGSLLFLLPPLLWNARHDWITLQHTGHHFESGAGDGGSVLVERATAFLEFLGTQLGVLSPVTAVVLYVLALGGLRKLFRRGSSVGSSGGKKSPLERRERFLVVFCGLPLAAMLLLALRQKLQPNWPAVFYLAGILLMAAWVVSLFRRAPDPESARRRRRVFHGLIVASLLTLVSFFYFGGALFQLAGKEGHKADPNRRLLGHDRLAAEFQQLREGVPGWREHFVAALNHRDLTSHLAFHLPDQPEVFRYEGSGEVRSQYELWPDPAEAGWLGKDGLFLSRGRARLPRPLRDCFDEIELVGRFEVRYGYDRSAEYSVYRGIGLRSWPGKSPGGDSPGREGVRGREKEKD